MRTLNSYVVDKLIQWEGEILYSYDDFDPKRRFIQAGMPVRGTLTIGVGHTGKDVRPGMRLTREQSRALLLSDLAPRIAWVEHAVKVPLNDFQFGALVSFVFNVGEGAFLKSTLLKKLNAGDYKAVPTELMKFTMSKGKKMEGLVNRRSAEIGLWNKQAFVASSNIVPDAPKAAASAKIGGAGTAVIAVGAGGAGAVTEMANQLKPYADVQFVKYILIALSLVGVAFTAYAAWKRYKESI